MKTTSSLISLLIRFMNLRLPSAIRTIPAFLFYLVVSLFSLNSAQASHVPGGYITYNCLSANTYEVTAVLIRDCSGIAIVPGSGLNISLTNDCALTNTTYNFNFS